MSGGGSSAGKQFPLNDAIETADVYAAPPDVSADGTAEDETDRGATSDRFETRAEAGGASYPRVARTDTFNANEYGNGCGVKKTGGDRDVDGRASSIAVGDNTLAGEFAVRRGDSATHACGLYEISCGTLGFDLGDQRERSGE